MSPSRRRPDVAPAQEREPELALARPSLALVRERGSCSDEPVRRSLFALLAISACMAGEDTARAVLEKNGYTVLALGPPTAAEYTYSFKATRDGKSCAGNIAVSGLAWFPEYTQVAECKEKRPAEQDTPKPE